MLIERFSLCCELKAFENNNKFSIKIGVNNLTSDQIPSDIHKKLIEKFQ